MLEGGHVTHPQVADSEEVEAPKVAKAWGSDTCPACSAATLMWYGWHIDDMSIIRHLKLLQSAVKCGKHGRNHFVFKGYSSDSSREIPPKSELANPAISLTKTDEAAALTLGTCDASVRHPSQLKLPKTECPMKFHK